MQDCAQYGEGSLCVQKRCEQQCSTDDHTCAPVSELFDQGDASLEMCRDALRDATSVCIPQGPLKTVLQERVAAVKKELTSLRPTNTLESPTPECSVVRPPP